MDKITDHLASYLLSYTHRMNAKKKLGKMNVVKFYMIKVKKIAKFKYVIVVQNKNDIFTV